MQTNEQSFEAKIEERLLSSEIGYTKRLPEQYDKLLCLDTEILLNFIKTTQPNEWTKLTEQYGEETEQRFAKRVHDEVGRRGLVDILRNGVSDRGAHFKLAYFKPVSGLNLEHEGRYKQNQFTVMRQVAYTDAYHNTIDMVLFLNGLPIITGELKNLFTGQDYTNAIRQYRKDRDPKEPLFGRCLAHFAVDNDIAYFSTQLAGMGTRFLPFNKDLRNPDDPRGFKVAYLYEDIWHPDSLLEIIDHFLFLEADREKETKTLIFPRFHQLMTVRDLVKTAQSVGPGKNYLIQHSAGSGKTYTISWLAHQLSQIFNANNERVFDTIIIISDRRVIDKQLRDAVFLFEKSPGVIIGSQHSS